MLRITIFVGGWLFLLGTVVLMVKLVEADRVRREESKEARAARQAGKEAFTGIARDVDERDRVLLNKVFPSCAQSFYGFLQSAAPEERAQWVVGGAAQAAARMERNAGGPALVMSEALPRSEYLGVIWLNDEPLIESLWVNSEGYRMEVVFRRERSDWRIDWESFVRYSAVPWVMFAAGEGEPVQEFRLLARQRLLASSEYDPALSIVFHVPRFGVLNESGASSPEFVVAKGSAAGEKLRSLFRMKRQGLVPLGARLPLQDPEGMIRVRVRIRREDNGKERQFVLEDVLAGHWLGIKESGIPEHQDTASDPTKDE